MEFPVACDVGADGGASALPLDSSRIRKIGLLIADKREGAFALDVDWIGLE